jgi:hypothetical protein
VVYPLPTKKAMTNESQRCNCFIRNERNAVPKHACPEAKGSNPTTGLTLLWAHNPFRGHFNHGQVSQEKAGRVFKRRYGNGKVLRFKYTRIKSYNTLPLPTLLYGSENWTIKARYATRLTAAEMK